MKVLRKWLEEYGEIKLSDDELVLRLAETGTEVEEYTKLIDDKVIAAEIVNISSHPNADRLRLVVVSDGTNKIELVCGAPNIEVGQRVPLAQVGARIRGQVIEQTDIRGQLSNGMLCSEMELGLGDDDDGIKILPDNVSIGDKLNDYFSVETLFDLEITPNRGDCLSHLGMAREIAAITGSGVRREPIKLTMDSKSANSEVEVEIQAKKHCSQYLARVIKGVKVSPSPKWLSSKLEKLGLKAINNIVDVTNYIMYDLGQPLHAFDGDKISDGKIVVRSAKKDESIVTLDDKERPLSETDLVIADNKLAIAIAGVMGGKNSEIDDRTTNVILEAAVFERRSVRKTARKLGAITDASYRFERGIDEMGLEYAINKAAELIKKIAGGSILSGIVRDGSPSALDEVDIKHSKINRLLGTDISDSDIDSFLKRLGFEIKGAVAVVPSWRHDIFSWQDLAEEIGRIYGYSKIPSEKLPERKAERRGNYYFKEGIKDLLAENGFSEVINYPFLSEEDIKMIGEDPKELLEVANPVQPENKYLRSNLINRILKNISKNSAFSPIAIFEIGQVFSKTHEHTHLAVGVAGKDQKSTLELIDKAKSKLSDLLTLAVTIDTQEIDSPTLKKLKIRKPAVAYFEVNLSQIIEKSSKDGAFDLKISKEEVVYRPVSRFPSVTRDLAFVVDNKTKAADVSLAIYQVSDVVNRVELFDEFSSDKLGKNKKNLAFHIFLQDMNKTLNDIDADTIINSIVKVIEKNFSADLRA